MDRPFRTMYVGEWNGRHERPSVVVSRSTEGFHFEYADRTSLWIDERATTVWCTWTDDASLEDAVTYFAGPVLGFLLRLRGALALHASGVQVGNAALIMVGPHGAGKSTIAAALGRRGCRVIADDVLRLSGRGSSWVAEPCGTVLRLWDEGARLALGAEATLPSLTPTWDKRGLSVGTHAVEGATAAVPVGAIICLGPREPATDAPRLEPIGPSDALVELAMHSSASHLIGDRARADEFHMLSDIVRQTPCVRAVAASDTSAFDLFVDLVLTWARSRLTAPEAASCR